MLKVKALESLRFFSPSCVCLLKLVTVVRVQVGYVTHKVQSKEVGLWANAWLRVVSLLFCSKVKGFRHQVVT
jgi:hypothetical protein